MDNFGDRLKSERKRLGYGADEFAKIGGCGRTTQFKYESNETSPDLNYLDRIGEVGADLVYIVTGQLSKGEVYKDPKDAMRAVVDAFTELEIALTGEQIKSLTGLAYTAQLSFEQLKEVVRHSYALLDKLKKENT